MDVIRHEAKGNYPMLEPLNAFMKEEVQPVTIVILEENILARVPTQYHVVDSTRIMYSRFPCHVYLHPAIFHSFRHDPIGFPTPLVS